MSPSFSEVINTRFSHYEDFENLPSQVYFTMIIYDWNTSAAIDIEGAEKDITSLSFNDFPGENISYI